ncbi:LacI family DNA-binding transcriptional regulator [Pelagicoccus sp. NFK12]|uniref:LacI family DNA-binding transcriptional regulator n=1 Tax=Pelagicoccus enzymogenes TaxID=2773457 RepID=A0A927FCS4_9BACT|nr:LacI family DNA-binding transcriptional regulator [Pelagicoccus enzymogenes]MBD5782014.1 LacI family DNA-binding transcriptional regulator [Pelagicoccus enzymogenes]MDQ8196769.1 LacI family DNA-binding transcriptional regulator [Pelagicoccus enzymogenes]
MTQPKKKRISQAQIAKEIGCSQALVSMALNGHTKGISEKTYNAIRELAAQQGYTPKGMKIEGSLGEFQQRTIGYILRSPLKLANKSNFFSHIHQGLHEHLLEHKLKTVYLGSEDDINSSAGSFASHFPESVRGIAIMGEVRPTFLSQVLETDRPVVYVSARASGQCHSVLSNEFESGELLVKHLYDLGHRSFAWLGGGKPKGRHDDRLTAVEAALAKRGLSLEKPAKVTLDGADRNEGYQAAKQIISQMDPLPTAWICLNALMARGAINRLLQHQVEIGTTVSIAAFDMTRVCEEEHPTLTSAGADPEVMGREAGRILTHSLETKSPGLTDVTLPAVLKVRESTGPVPTAVAR